MELPEFRVFDHGDNRMRYAEIEHFDDMFGFRFEHKSPAADMGDAEIEIMQYSGLKGLREKKIFHKDIIDYQGVYYVVEINFGGFGFYDRTQKWIWLYSIAPHCMVEGNIFENPNLVPSSYKQ